MKKDEAIASLKEQIHKIRLVRGTRRFGATFKKWHRDTRVVLENVFPNPESYVREFMDIQYDLGVTHPSTTEDEHDATYIYGLEHAEVFLQSCIEEIEKYWKEQDSAQETSITNLIRILGKLRECCQYLERPPSNEREVQDILWIMLRSHFDRVDREDTLPKFGTKNYRPDFGIPELRQLIEVKFIGDKTPLPEIQESIIADIPGYLTGNSRFDTVIILVYDYAHKLRDPKKFIEDLRSVNGIADVVVIPGIGAHSA